jgi:hypothetical protein
VVLYFICFADMGIESRFLWCVASTLPLSYTPSPGITLFLWQIIYIGEDIKVSRIHNKLDDVYHQWKNLLNVTFL